MHAQELVDGHDDADAQVVMTRYSRSLRFEWERC